MPAGTTPPSEEPVPPPVAKEEARIEPAVDGCTALAQRIDEPSMDIERARDTFTRARAASDGDPPCAAHLRDALARATTCGRGATAIAIGLFGSARFPASSTADVVRRASAGCEASVLRAVHEAHDVDADLVSAVRARIPRTGGAGDRAPAWLALGSLAANARAIGRSKIADDIDASIEAGLGPSWGELRTLFLAASGNAGCVRCVAHARASTNDPDPSIRSAAAAAWRLVPTREAGAAMCRAATHDAEANVRDQATWALGFGQKTDPRREERVRCLVAVARADASKTTRRTAVSALAMLDADVALRALEDDAATPADVRAAVAEHFTTTTRPARERFELP